MRLWFQLTFYSFFLISSANAEVYGWKPLKVSQFSSSVRVTGRVTPQEGALNIESARITGRILTILSREGDRVQAGTPLFEISSAECLSLGEERKVAEKRDIPDLIQGVNTRETQLGISLKDDRCRIVASHAGSVTKRSVESGTAFNVGDTLMTILDTHRLSVELDLPERDLSRVKAGQKVSFQVAADPAHTMTTKVKAVVPAIDVASRTARVRLDPVPLASKASLDGLIYGQIETGTKEPVFKIPSRALVFNRDSRFVIKGPENLPQAVEVEVLGESGDGTSVRPKQAGLLKDGDEIATENAIFLMKKINEGGEKP